MQAEDVAALYTLLEERGVQLWVDGGWGIDALLNRQTRPHKDFDALVSLDELATMTSVLAEHGFSLKELWSENRWVSHVGRASLVGRVGATGGEVATAFVLRDGSGRELDVHVMTVDERGKGVPAWNATLIFPADALAGCGSIAGTPVRCLSAQMQMATHTGYALQDKDLQDLRLLHEQFGIAYLEEQARHFPQV